MTPRVHPPGGVHPAGRQSLAALAAAPTAAAHAAPRWHLWPLGGVAPPSPYVYS